jgi:hypothetical protein
MPHGMIYTYTAPFIEYLSVALYKLPTYRYLLKVHGFA